MNSWKKQILLGSLPPRISFPQHRWTPQTCIHPTMHIEDDDKKFFKQICPLNVSSSQTNLLCLNFNSNFFNIPQKKVTLQCPSSVSHHLKNKPDFFSHKFELSKKNDFLIDATKRKAAHHFLKGLDYLNIQGTRWKQEKDWLQKEIFELKNFHLEILSKKFVVKN